MLTLKYRAFVNDWFANFANHRPVSPLQTACKCANPVFSNSHRQVVGQNRLLCLQIKICKPRRVKGQDFTIILLNPISCHTFRASLACSSARQSLSQLRLGKNRPINHTYSKIAQYPAYSAIWLRKIEKSRKWADLTQKIKICTSFRPEKSRKFIR